MRRIVIFAGIPGSGKTSRAEELVEQGFYRLCADDIRVELYGDAAIQGDAAEVYKVFYERLDKLLSESRDVIVDNTNILIEHRQPIIKRAENAGYDRVEIWLFDVPLAVCLERNLQRERVVPEEVIIEMHSDLFGANRPQPTEGKLIVIGEGEPTPDLYSRIDYFKQSYHKSKKQQKPLE